MRLTVPMTVPRPVLALLPAGVALALAVTTVHADERIEREDVMAAVDTIVEEALANGAVGLSVGVAFDGEVVHEAGYGMVEVEHGVEADAESMFRIGSITKQFTAALIMEQVEAGTIDLDASINTYTDYPTGEHTVTVRHLLHHTSGIKSYTSLGPAWTKTIPLELSHDELLDLVDDLPFEFAPGERHAYCNTGYYLLGVILEEVTGKSYADLVSEQIAAPLQLERTRYGSNTDVITNRAQGYSRAGNGDLKNDTLIGMSQPGAAGALLSTGGDLLRWQIALRTGTYVSADSYALMTTPGTLTDGTAHDYGFGLSIQRDGSGPDSIRHGGGINGFNSMLVHFPEADIGIAVISNCESFDASRVTRKIARRMHGEAEVAVVDLPVPTSEQERVTGTYVLNDAPLEFVIRAEGEQLFAKVTGQAETRLLFQSEGNYRVQIDDEIEMIFDAGTPSPGLTLKQGGGEYKAARKP